ncbi:hypothetical protein G7Y89_g11523 [Cudoniella acicularis]|uniref:Short-chain dehydrogenase n=1 Tax=Cudoniella acicularis TaxID=354080 RepID=A0A8H4RBT6_9HELO|nr:hypothetical protein G7Y89_g11523 [Cudoniella acicularis]
MSDIILILGAGPNVGFSLVKLFSAKGFKTAIASRSPKAELSAAADLVVKADFEDPSSIKAVFKEVREKLGVPNVVVYNAASGIFASDPVSVGLEKFTATLNVNVVSAYAALQEFVTSIRTLSKDVLKTFIYTGNSLNLVPLPIVLHTGMGKAGAAHLIEGSALAYKKEGFRFYYTDERFEDGGSVFMDIDGQAHADFYYELVRRKDQGPWEATFVKGKGYVDFDGKVALAPPFWRGEQT